MIDIKSLKKLTLSVSYMGGSFEEFQIDSWAINNNCLTFENENDEFLIVPMANIAWVKVRTNI